MKKTFALTTALVISVAPGNLASAADTGSSTTRQWGGLWMGFGAGYGSSTARGGGFESSGCVTSTRSSGSGVNKVNAECDVANGRVDVFTEIDIQVSDDGVNGELAVAYNDASAEISTPSARNQTFIIAGNNFSGSGIAIIDALSTTGPEASAGTSALVSETSTNGSGTSNGTPVSGLVIADGEFAPRVSASGYAAANAATGAYVGWSSLSGSAGGSSAEAFAFGYSGLSDAMMSASDGDLAPSIHVRLDHQTQGNWIIGGELEVSKIGGASDEAPTQFEGVTREFDSEANLLASARLRLGYAAGDFLFYGTGGLAYTEVDSTLRTSAADGGTPISESYSKSEDAFGGVVGGGISAFVANNAAISLEGLYYRFDETIDLDDAGEDASVTFEDAFTVSMKFSLRAN